MKLFLVSILFSLAVFLGTAAMAETLKDEAAMRKFGDEVMAKVGNGDLKAAFEVMRPYVSKNDIDFDAEIKESIETRHQFAMRIGPPSGYQFLSDKKLGGFLYRLMYIETAKKKALPWRFDFYKTDEGWILQEFAWTEQLAVAFSSN